jgi:hypothetical protein
MKNFVCALIILPLVLTYSCSNNQNKEFDHYGIFIEAKSATVEIKGYEFERIHDHFLGSDINNTISFELKNASDPLQIYVYSKSTTDEFVLLTDLKNSNGEYVCCFNCGSYDRRPDEVCKSVDMIEKPMKNIDYRFFEAKVSAGTFCLMNKTTSKGYIFRVI